MKFRLLVVLASLALILGANFLFLVNPVSAESSVYYSTSNDGTLTSFSNVYSTAHNSHVVAGYDNCSAEVNSSSVTVGQDNTSGIYTINRAVFVFDTRTIPTYASISSWRISLYGISASIAESDNIAIVYGGDVSNPMVYSDFDIVGKKTAPITEYVSTTSWSSGSYNIFNGTDINAINIGGYTVVGVRFVSDINSIAPAGTNYVTIASSESTHVPKLTITYTDMALGAPDELSISDAAVFTTYRTTGDQLFIFTAICKYRSTPSSTYSPSDYYLIQLIGTDNSVLAQTPLVRWGYSPQGIYLKPVNAVSWGENYTITITSTTMVSTPSVSSYTLVSNDWVGKNDKKLKFWIQHIANEMGYADEGNMRYYYDGSRINIEGSGIFNEGIPYITTALPSIFDTPGADIGDVAPSTESYSSTLYSHWGTYWTTAFDSIGGTIGLSGTWVYGFGIAILCVIAYAIVSSSTHNSGLALICVIPVIGIGVFFGAPPLIAVTAAAIAGGLMLTLNAVLYKM